MPKSVIQEAEEIQLAMELIKLGARLQFLEAETSLSRDRLIKLYKEIKGISPPKGLLPFSTDWFMTWNANIHSSMFYNIYRFMVTHGECEQIVAVMKSYRLYLEQVERYEGEVILDFTRARTLVRFFDSEMLQLTPCSQCQGKFVTHAHDPQIGFTCALCRPPSRAGKTRKVADKVKNERVIAPNNAEKNDNFTVVSKPELDLA
ncbi:flagellar transcriptional regulator FlhC [Glaciimonas soli]|uniref:Flagellar transcriptional regulator FlhC n=1 Tax=Glaciimonas soli TaxID=2590999 RepID=A0A843YNY2_9BURK|nr:flagellar transcriptional regulator FlhC [Glaciimonas soli]MQQ99483.1 flagellar transcriptional regulator FlhC [Glaciimonas soli]